MAFPLIGLATFDVMHTILGIVALAVLLMTWKLHRDPTVSFNVFDLFMENGRLSRISTAFMLTLGITTWLMVDLELKGKMTEGYLMSYGGMWVAPLTARLIFNKTEPLPPEHPERRTGDQPGTL